VIDERITAVLRYTVVACAAALSTSSALPAQGVDSSCVIAAEKLRTTSRIEDGGRYLNHLASCGSSPVVAQAVATALRNSRQSRDTVWLRSLDSFAREPLVVGALLEIMQEPQATKEARITAMLTLIELRDPYRVARYKDITGGFDGGGLPIKGCQSGIRAGIGAVAHLPPNVLAEITGDAKRIVDDRRIDSDVRTAAACVEMTYLAHPGP
jgi:hypothetical protein